ncbi:hypothetical protein L3V82_10200 [Thiotrichales bacterium 19S3-7]|nr:hypothetical protein [Thiotrichales bacterium 19S3-7]MCF6802527.1 hypothetical protein [Thiotrichales bacterium 19S3-11]
MVNTKFLNHLIILAGLFFLCYGTLIAKDPCQLAYKALAEDDDIIHVTEYDIRLPSKTVTNTIYTSKDCQSFKKEFSVTDPDLVKCTNGHYISVLPSSEIKPNLKCFKVITCVGKICKSNMIYLKYNKEIKKYTAIPRSSYLIFS